MVNTVYSQIYTAQGAQIDLNNVDVPTENGFIHVINAVMFPPTETIYELVSNNPDFSTLKTAIDTAGIADVINSEYSIMIFPQTRSILGTLNEWATHELLHKA